MSTNTNTEVPQGYRVVQRRTRNYDNSRAGGAGAGGNASGNVGGGDRRREPRVNHKDVLEKVKNGELDVNEAQKMLRRRPITNGPRYTFRVTNRGAIAVFGLQRRPVILYANQWQKIEQLMPSLKNFVMNNQNVIMNKREQFIASVKAYHANQQQSHDDASAGADGTGDDGTTYADVASQADN